MPSASPKSHEQIVQWFEAIADILQRQNLSQPLNCLTNLFRKRNLVVGFAPKKECHLTEYRNNVLANGRTLMVFMERLIGDSTMLIDKLYKRVNC
jgi:hypothetical protein